VATGDDPLFEARTPLAFSVRVTRRRWQLIIAEKHPAMAGRELDVRAALETPDEIRQSQTDSSVFLFYKLQRKGRWVCAVSKQEGSGGFLITTYPTDAIKEGARVWPR
jgi:hypothetical protein